MIVFLTNSTVNSQEIKQSSGIIKRFEQFYSEYVSPRNIDVWLPDNYNTDRKYAVLYMHDGQMLFDPATTWNHQAWDADDVAAKLMEEGSVMDFIIVGIWNSEKKRHSDYFPQKPFESLSQEQKNTIIHQLQYAEKTIDTFQPNSDNYLKFIVDELKPYIDKSFSVYTDKNHTFIAGSSMGGLISMYAVTQYPDIFGGAACISTHWPGIFSVENNPIPDAFAEYLVSTLPHMNNNYLYFDHGDQTLDAFYPPLQKKIDNIMASYPSNLWTSKFFAGADHSERSWNKRLHIPLEFLLNKINK